MEDIAATTSAQAQASDAFDAEPLPASLTNVELRPDDPFDWEAYT
jgi:hypothetical protein